MLAGDLIATATPVKSKSPRTKYPGAFTWSAIWVSVLQDYQHQHAC
jgi:hypothetical protein